MSRRHIKPEKTVSDFLLSDSAKMIIAQHEKSLRPSNFMNDFRTPQAAPTLTKDSGLISDSDLPINQCDFNPFYKINKTLLNSRFLGYQEYSLLSQNGIIQNIMQNYAQDSTREWITVFSKEDKVGSDVDKIEKIEEEFKRLKVKDTIRLAVEQTILFGGCKIYPKIEGDDSQDGGNELLTPLYLEKIKKGSLLYLKVIEPLYATPLEFNATRPLIDDYYRPNVWSIIGTQMHYTRLLHFAYNYVPTLLKPIYWFNGMPLVQLCLDYLYGFETVRQNIVGVSGRYNINVFKTNLTALLNYKDGSSYQSGEDALSRLKLANALANNFSIFALDNNPSAPEEWEQFNMTIAGLSEILTTNADLCAAASMMPVIKLFGRGSKTGGGLGENHDAELRLWYDRIGCFQENVIRPNLDPIFQMAQMNIFGKINPKLDYKFNPLWKKSDLEIWQIQKLKQDVNSSYFADGILEGNEIRESLSKDPDSGYSNLKNLDEDAFEEEVELDEKAPKKAN